jgi:hypothetical protein
MSRKDYRALAAILSRHNALPVGLVDELSDWLKSDNPQFDRDRFADASLPRVSARTLAAVALEADALDARLRRLAS